jgi:diaminopimelate decarboxylase
MLRSRDMSAPVDRHGDPVDSAALIGHTIVVRHCAQWRSALSHSEIVVPAGILRVPASVGWVHEHGLGVEVGSDGDLDVAVSAGIAPARMVFRGDYAPTHTVWHAVGLGVGSFVVGAERQILLVSACAPFPQRVLVDATAGIPRRLVDLVSAEPRLEVIGLYCHLNSFDPAEDIDRVIDRMAHFRRDHATGLRYLGLAVCQPDNVVPQTRQHLGPAIEEAINAACLRVRFPRPRVMVTLQLPAGAADR